MFDDSKIVNLDEYELAEVMDKVRAIRIPNRFPYWPRAIYEYETDGGWWFDLSVSHDPMSILAQGGLFRLANYIDFADIAFSFNESKEVAAPNECLMGVVAGDFRKHWSRRQCEAFVDDANNFQAVKYPFDPEEFNCRRKLAC